jgi:hypothetical protein
MNYRNIIRNQIGKSGRGPEINENSRKGVDGKINALCIMKKYYLDTNELAKVFFLNQKKIEHAK